MFNARTVPKTLFFSYSQIEDILNLDPDQSDIDSSNSDMEKLQVTLSHDYAPAPPFSNAFYQSLTTKTWEPSDDSDEPPYNRYIHFGPGIVKKRKLFNDFNENSSQNETPKAKKLRISVEPKSMNKQVEAIETGNVSTKSLNNNSVDSRDLEQGCIVDLCSGKSLLDITNTTAESALKLSETDQQIKTPENPPQSSKKSKKKHRRVSKAKATKTFLSTPPWFLDPAQACFQCKRFMGKYEYMHKSHRVENPLFSEAPFLDKASAAQWTILFDNLVNKIKTYFKANSGAHLLQILHKKMPQPERPPAWNDITKYVLSLYHDKFYDAVEVGQVSFSPPNSLKVLADELYFRKLLQITDLEFAKSVNNLQ